MLNQNDRRRLEEIERRLREEDPEFARRFTRGRPRRTGMTRLWAVLVLVVGGLGMVISLLVVLPAVLVLSLAATVAGVLLLRRSDPRAGPMSG
jgi:Flp pilus assembly protein TadB